MGRWVGALVYLIEFHVPPDLLVACNVLAVAKKGQEKLQQCTRRRTNGQLVVLRQSLPTLQLQCTFPTR